MMRALSGHYDQAARGRSLPVAPSGASCETPVTIFRFLDSCHTGLA